MKVEMYDKNGLIIKTKEKFCTEDIEVIPSFPTESGNNLQLYPPNVSIVDQDFAVIEDPDNGLFATSWRLYANERLIDNNADKDTRIDLTAFFGENGDFTLQAKSFSERFLPSNFSEPINYIRVVFTEGLTYRLIDSSNSLRACSGIGTATGPYIAIANTYSGDPVVAVYTSAFEGNMDITGVYIPEGVKEIQSDAFKNCYALETVTLPSTLEYVAGGAFYMDTGSSSNPAPPSRLSRVNYLGTIDQWSQIYISSSPLAYADTLYINGRKLTEAIVLSNEVTQIARGAFLYFKVPSITIPDSVTSIGESAFYGCNSEIIWGGTPTITEIGTSVFSGYKGQSITIPDSVTSIGESAFANCSSLTSIVIPDSVNVIGHHAFSNSSFVEITIALSPGLRIPRSAFNNNRKLTTVNFVGNTYAGSIAEWAFSDCSSLVEITIPVLADSPINIGDNCFDGCSKLAKIIFSKNADLGNEVFQNCIRLLLVDFRNATKVGKLGTNVFPISNYKIVVPDSLYAEWIVAENWSTYADHIVKASEYVES